jgi:hypothetical protein
MTDWNKTRRKKLWLFWGLLRSEMERVTFRIWRTCTNPSTSNNIISSLGGIHFGVHKVHLFRYLVLNFHLISFTYQLRLGWGEAISVAWIIERLKRLNLIPSNRYVPYCEFYFKINFVYSFTLAHFLYMLEQQLETLYSGPFLIKILQIQFLINSL